MGNLFFLLLMSLTRLHFVDVTHSCALLRNSQTVSFSKHLPNNLLKSENNSYFCVILMSVDTTFLFVKNIRIFNQTLRIE